MRTRKWETPAPLRICACVLVSHAHTRAELQIMGMFKKADYLTYVLFNMLVQIAQGPADV